MTRYANGQIWGNLGVKIEGKKSVDECMKEAGLDYDVSLNDCYIKTGSGEQVVPKLKITMRDDNKTIMGTVGTSYTVLQNKESFSWFNEFIDNDIATIEHAGQLGKSGIVFVQAKVNVAPVEIVKGDEIQSFITLLNSFDGSTAVSALFMPVRLWCQNQIPKLKSSTKLKLKHTKNLHIGLDKIREIMDVHNREFVATAEQFRFLASKGVNKKDLERYVKLVFEKEDETEEKEMRKSKVEAIQTLFESGRGANSDTRNLYGAAMACNEFLNWEAGRTEENRIKSLWTGTNANVNSRIFEIAMKVAKGEI